VELSPNNRITLRAQLEALDLSSRAEEVSARERMIALLDGTPDCFLRTSFPGHFTGSALVVNADGSRVLLHHHRKLDRWLQFGGHCDGDEDVLRVARREALEESGIDGLIVASARPFDIDIHEIPPHGTEPAHFHYDVRFMFIAPEAAAPAASHESRELCWFTAADAAALPIDDSLRRMIGKWQRIVARRAHS
jgi:8-oxo-dGTP pyrophosphatase MutT (NUDIX family)